LSSFLQQAEFQVFLRQTLKICLSADFTVFRRKIPNISKMSGNIQRLCSGNKNEYKTIDEDATKPEIFSLKVDVTYIS
jgi:hypothetical protein